MSKTDVVQARKKLSKLCGLEVVSAIEGAQRHELEDRLVRLATHERETLQRLERDPSIKALSEELKTLKGPYTDTIKGIELQRTLIAFQLEHRGE